MKPIKLFYCIFIFIIGSLLLFSDCSLDPMAGGTGVGNPNSVATMAIIADTGISRSDEYDELPILDKDSLVLIVKTANLLTNKITFMQDREPYRDKIDGPIIFDALKGTSIPSLDSIPLTAGIYTGIKLHLHNTDTVMGGNTIILAGIFAYKDTIRNFSIQLDHTLNPHFKFDGGPVTVSENDTINFELVLNADLWLYNITLKKYLDEGSITLNQNGDLVIDKTTNTELYKVLKQDIRDNIINSGILINSNVNFIE